MAPKSRKPATKKTNKTEGQIMSELRHNMTAHLDPEGKFVDFKEITQWLRESRINKLDVDLTPKILNNVLELQDVADAPFSVPIMCTRRCLLRMKCIADIFAGKINKATLPMRYKVLVTCKKFWMYPTFMQMIKNAQHPDLPEADTGILKIETMLDHSFNLFKGHSAKKYKESDPPRKMFGALLNRNYVAPTNDKWCHDDSQSDDEEPDDDDEEGGDAGTTAASAPGASSAGGDEQADSDYVPSDTETERVQKKKTVVLGKKKDKKNIGTSSSAQQSAPSEP
ncbi:hypothetical protein Hanom_Chr11g01028381 [Helianthus anomalus]